MGVSRVAIYGVSAPSQITDGSITAAKLAPGVAGAWALLEDTTIGAATATINITSVAGYTEIRIYFETKLASGTANLYMKCNSDAGNNYNYQLLTGAGTTAAAANGAGVGQCILGLIHSANKNNLILHFENTDNSLYKTYVSQLGATSSQVSTGSGQWNNTNAAITSIQLTNSTGVNFNIGTRYIIEGRA